ncbi:DUF1850 domain-containing protein [Ureibacillus sp. GCM10028918]|uniref:DUF1850 domain-containing protein n=1 Tax=Ureibacillus sp. GCM10028918 TaxID=3273429 RepID=UPI00360E95C9
MKRAFFFLVIFIIGIIFLFSPFYTVLSFEETRTNNPQRFYINVSKENNFNIRYTHSIHLTDVLETYEITDSNQIRLRSMEYEDVAIGMPAHAEEGQTVSYENGKYKLQFSNETLDSFTLYVGDINQELAVIYNGQTYDLKKSLERGSAFLFEIKNISLIDKLRGVVMVNEGER